MDAVQVGPQRADQDQQDEGDQQSHQRDGNGCVSDNLQRKHLPILQIDRLTRPL